MLVTKMRITVDHFSAFPVIYLVFAEQLLEYRFARANAPMCGLDHSNENQQSPIFLLLLSALLY